ncbi:MAG: hypothetical protein IKN54_00950, partial [Lachnospiraceae bacterium]|nr:hypothetical protein [Lachnospiraceae bacterium]
RTTSIIHEPLAILLAIVFAAVFIAFQNGSRKKKKELSRVVYMRLKDKCIDALDAYELEDIHKILENKDTKAYKEFKNLSVEFDQFCVDMEEDKYDKRTLYEYFRGNITDHFRKVIKLVTEEEESVEEFFKWYDAEKDIHLSEDEYDFVKHLDE